MDTINIIKIVLVAVGILISASWNVIGGKNKHKRKTLKQEQELEQQKKLERKQELRRRKELKQQRTLERRREAEREKKLQRQQEIDRRKREESERQEELARQQREAVARAEARRLQKQQQQMQRGAEAMDWQESERTATSRNARGLATSAGSVVAQESDALQSNDVEQMVARMLAQQQKTDERQRQEEARKNQGAMDLRTMIIASELLKPKYEEC
ncbi:MAG: hypothetical protein K2G93_06230 [Rikenella sp.]|nr:hypothetical protein [Rikenella sp.]